MKVAILTPAKETYSETFIRAHSDLVAPTVVFHGGVLPAYIDGRRIDGPGFLGYIQWFLQRTVVKQESYCSRHERSLIRALRGHQITLAIAEYGTVGARVWRSCVEAKVPFITFFRGYDISRAEVIEKHLRDYEDVFVESARIVAVSEDIKKRLEKLGCPSEKIIVLPSGAAKEFFDVIRESDSRTLLSVGRFVEKKAPHLVLEVFRRLSGEFSDLRLEMVGIGPLLPICKSLAKAWGIESKIKFHGVLTPEQIRERMGTAALFLQHSVIADDGDSEGTPNSIQEAAAAGMPIVATRHGGIPEVVIDGETGLLVDEFDVDGMVEKVRWVLNNQIKAEEMGALARMRAAEGFSREGHLRVLNNLISEIIGSRK